MFAVRVVLAVLLCAAALAAGGAVGPALAADGAGTPLAADGAGTPLAAGGAGTPLAADGAGTPLAADGADTPVLHAGATAGVQSTGDDATIEQTVTYARMPGVDGAVAVQREFQVDDSVSQLRVGLWSSEQVTGAEGFEELDSGSYEWTGDTQRPSLTLRRDLVRPVETGGDGWAVAATTDVSWSARGSEPPSLATSYRVSGSGTVGSDLAVLGAHDEHVREAPGHDVRVVVPDGVSPTASPVAAADALAATARERPADVPADEVLVVSVAGSSFRGAADGTDAVVRADQPLEGGSTWFHEFGHARQQFNTTDETAWLREGHAEYVQYRRSARQGLLDHEAFRDAMARGRDAAYDDVVLTDESTWDDTGADYDRGALVLHAVDVAIHDATLGQRDVGDVFERLNAVDSGPVTEQEPVGHRAFVEHVRAVGGDGPAELADRLATTTDEPAIADRETFDELVGPRTDASVVVSPESDGAATHWLEPDPAAESFGWLRHDVAAGDGEVPARIVRAVVTAEDVSEAPRGFELELSVGDPGVLSIAGADAGPAFGSDEAPSVSPDGRTVRIASDGPIDLSAPGAVDRDTGGLVLATVDLRIAGAGDTRIEPLNATLQRSDASVRVHASRTATVAVDRQPVPEMDGATPRDVDGDGRYRDVTSDGTVGQTDVLRFFERMHRETIQTSPALFDFSDSGSVGHGDVVALFRYVATS